MEDSLGYIAALDIGTTTIRCQILNHQAKCVGSSFDTVKLHYPDRNSVEIVPEELWNATLQVVKNAVKNAEISMHQVQSLAISTQRATFLTWSKDSGEPIHNFITWKDLRASEITQQINRSWKMRLLRKACYCVHLVTRVAKFGIVSNMKFTSSHVTPRLLWLLQNHKEVQTELANHNLAFGTIDTWLLYKLTGGRTYVTDVTNASATGLYDPFSLCWSFVPQLFNIPLSILPPVVDNDYDFGLTETSIFGIPIKIGTVMADQSASMFGSLSLREGDVKLTLGTGAFLDVNTGKSISSSVAGFYPLMGWKSKKEMVFLSEVACSDAGSLVQWMVSVGFVSRVDDLADIISGTKDNGDVYFVPAFSGLGPPFNDETAGTGFIGIKPTTTKGHLVRAVLESIVYRIIYAYNLLSMLKSFYIRVDGGVSRNDFICQLLADLTGVAVKRSNLEMSTLGAAYFAGLCCGYWKSLDEILDIDRNDDVFEPTKSQSKKEALQLSMNHWRKAAEKLKCWY